jgi:hypothetical protein
MRGRPVIELNLADGLKCGEETVCVGCDKERARFVQTYLGSEDGDSTHKRGKVGSGNISRGGYEDPLEA